MIWKRDFEKINFEVEEAIKEIYTEIEKLDDYIVFLSSGNYIEEYERTPVNNPYVIDYRVDGYKDEAWREVLMTFLNSSYSFHNENSADSKVSIFFEKLMYLNIWESKPYLKHLNRISNLISKNDYLWKVSIKETSNFLKNQIIPTFEKKNLKIVDIIKKGYEKQIRNAIAHNDYSHNIAKPEIIFENYDKRNPSSIEKIHYNEWTIKFCYTLLLSYHLSNYFFNKRQELHDIGCIEGFNVKLMNKNNERIDGKIFYDKKNNTFKSYVIKNQ
jgi:hypothetical protein